MSWDCRLVNDKGETIALKEKHQLKGGTYAIGGTNERWLNVTYNYDKYIRECSDFPEGLDSLNDKSGIDSVKMLDNAIQLLEKKYKKNSRWVVSEREMTYFRNPSTGELISYYDASVDAMAKWQKVKVKEQVSEGQNSNYWLATAGNAIKALRGLRELANEKPYGVWKIN